MRSVALLGAFASAVLLSASIATCAVAASTSIPVSSAGTAPSFVPYSPPGAHVSPAADTVVVILTPFLTWNDITETNAPELHEFAERGAIANMNAKTADPGAPTAIGGALTMSAGRWTAGSTTASATPEELAAVRDANANSLNPPDIGALGAVLHAAGLQTAAVGNGDEDTSTPVGVRRPAALVATDRDGHVDIDETGPDLLHPDPNAPFGVRADRRRLASAVRSALASGAALIVIDPGDLERAHDATSLPLADAKRNHENAVRTTSAVVGDVVSALEDRRALVIVATPATEKSFFEPPYFGPAIVTGSGFAGELTSGATHQPGLVTSLDVAPTILAALSIEPTATMLGSPMTPIRNTSSLGTLDPGTFGGRVAFLSLLDTSVGVVDYTRDLLFLAPFALLAILITGFATAIALVPAVRRFRTTGRTLVLLALSIPPGAWLLFDVVRYTTSPTQVMVAFGAATLVTFALVLGVSTAFRVRPEVPLLALSTLTSLLICADQWTGHPFESGLFSYSIRAGWRYYGMGNEGAALLVGASIIAVGLACDLADDTRWARLARVTLMPTVGVVALTTIAAPFAGANVGAAIWGVVAYGVAWAAINRVRLGWRSIVAIALVIVAAVGTAAVVDLARGTGETHLARFFADIGHGEFSTVGTLVMRKAINSVRYILLTPYTLIALALAAGLAAVRWTGQRPLAYTLASRPSVSASLLGILIGSVAAMLTEDSGIVMPALMLFAGALPVFSLVLLDEAADKTDRRSPDDSARESLDPNVT